MAQVTPGSQTTSILAAYLSSPAQALPSRPPADTPAAEEIMVAGPSQSTAQETSGSQTSSVPTCTNSSALPLLLSPPSVRDCLRHRRRTERAIWGRGREGRSLPFARLREENFHVSSTRPPPYPSPVNGTIKVTQVPGIRNDRLRSVINLRGSPLTSICCSPSSTWMPSSSRTGTSRLNSSTSATTRSSSLAFKS